MKLQLLDPIPKSIEVDSPLRWAVCYRIGDPKTEAIRVRAVFDDHFAAETWMKSRAKVYNNVSYFIMEVVG